MLDKQLVALVYRSVREYFGCEVLTIEDVSKMTSIPGKGYNILSYQAGDLTILVWVQIQIKSEVHYVIRGIKTQAW